MERGARRKLREVSTPAADWLHLAPGAEAIDLPVHDAQLVAARSDRLARTLVLILRMDYLQRFLHARDEVRFVFAFEGVQSVRVTTSRPWPGGAPELPRSMPYEEQQRAIAEYRAKWREESLDASAFEASLADDHWFDVMEGELARGGGLVAMRLSGYVEGEGDRQMSIRAEHFDVRRSDDAPFDLEALQTAYEAYWDAFGGG